MRDPSTLQLGEDNSIDPANGSLMTEELVKKTGDHPAGSTIINEGDEDSMLQILREGVCKVEKTVSRGLIIRLRGEREWSESFQTSNHVSVDICIMYRAIRKIAHRKNLSGSGYSN